MVEQAPPWPKNGPASYFPSVEKKYGFVRRPPTPPKLPAGSWINPPEDNPEKEAAAQ